MSGDNPYAPPTTIEWSGDRCVTTTIELSRGMLKRAAGNRYDHWLRHIIVGITVSAVVASLAVISINELFVNRVTSDDSFADVNFASEVVAVSTTIMRFLYWAAMIAILAGVFGRFVLAHRFVRRQLQHWPLDANRKVAVAAGKHGLWFTEDETLLSHKVAGKLRIWFYSDMIILSSARNILIPIPRTGHSDATWEETQRSYRELLARF